MSTEFDSNGERFRVYTECDQEVVIDDRSDRREIVFDVDGADWILSYEDALALSRWLLERTATAE